jgi:hypothetical protein
MDDTPPDFVETHFGFAAACPRCGGWTTYGGMSHKAQCTGPDACQDRQDALIKQNGPDAVSDSWPTYWTN